jgi:hypothetical protein
MRVIKDKVHDLDLLRLSQAVRPVLGLMVDRRRPIQLGEHYMRRGGQGDADPGRSDVADKE